MKSEEEKRIKYPEFKQLMESFYQDEIKRIELDNSEKIKKQEKVKLRPIIIYEKHSKEIRLEFNIGINQMYRLKSLSEFYDRILNNETYQYGKNLEFVHKEENFTEDSKKILKFLLRYAELIKYVNSGTYNRFRYYGKGINDEYILINSSRVDDVFDILKGNKVDLERNYIKSEIEFVDDHPNLEFSLIKASTEEYLLFPNLDVNKCYIIDGNKYSYMLHDKKLYKCSKEYSTHELKIIHILKDNYQTNMKINKDGLKDFFSLIVPRIKNSILYEEDAIIKQYIPKTLKVKIYLDSDKDRNIIANIKFVYETLEFNPFKDNPNISRDVITEANVLNHLQQTGFLFDKKRGNLILAEEDKIYNFLTHDIEDYKACYDILIPKNFQQKQIKSPKISRIGVKIENNLLKIDLQNLNIDKSELIEVLKQYHLKKRYYRLKDGTFLNLYNNSDIAFIDNMMNTTEVSHKELR